MNDSRDRRGGKGQWLSSPSLWAEVGARALIHTTGITVVAVCVAWLAIGFGHLRWVISAQQVLGDSGLYLRELWTHLGLSALMWGGLYAVGRGVLKGGGRRSTRLVRARGTAITETLVVMPVLLLLILGLAQLAVNNLAGMLLNYGTHQAARTAWVWQPEVSPLDGVQGRMGVDDDHVQEMARLQLAAAMTPVAPSAFAGSRQLESDQFQQMRAVFLANQNQMPPFQDSGADAIYLAEDLDVFEVADDLSFARAMDGSTYTQRSVRKFTSAYEAAEVEVIDQDTDVGVEVTYWHQITFPLVGPVFGEQRSVGANSAPGHYMRMERDALFLAQVPPNASLPSQ